MLRGLENSAPPLAIHSIGPGLFVVDLQTVIGGQDDIAHLVLGDTQVPGGELPCSQTLAFLDKSFSERKLLKDWCDMLLH